MTVKSEVTIMKKHEKEDLNSDFYIQLQEKEKYNKKRKNKNKDREKARKKDSWYEE